MTLRERAAMKGSEDERLLVLVTASAEKAREIETVLGRPLLSRNLEIPEIQSLDVEVVARAKAAAAFALVGRPVVIDDSGICLDALNGLPGALTTWFVERLGPAGIAELVAKLRRPEATVSTCIALADARSTRTFVGTVRGAISPRPRGSGGFGFDSIFVPEGGECTYAEMADEERVRSSMRGLAVRQLREFLRQDGTL